MEERQKAWKKEQDDLSKIFRKLCKCRRKTLGKGDEDIVLSVAKKQSSGVFDKGKYLLAITIKN